mgnify:FL=1
MIYTYDKVKDFLELIPVDKIKNKNGTKKSYHNVALSFDIETSSVYLDDDFRMTKNQDGLKCSNMYIWQVAYNDHVLYGRYWKEFINFVALLHTRLYTSENRRVIIYVHNLAYEFQYIYKFFPWLEVFASKERKPIYACTTFGVEFRCSYILSGYNLNTLAKNLHDKKYSKLLGNLDYSLVRHNETELTQDELDYCFNDVLIVTQYIREQIEEFGDITKIPLTQTGKVRNYVKKNCFSNPEYKNFIRNLTLEPIEYKYLQQAFAGGFTHSNATKTDTTIENVSSFDFTSSYPYVMLSEKYPMSKGKQVKIESLQDAIKLFEKYCCLFTVELFNVKAKTANEQILQFSKCTDVKKGVLNNGRIVQCESCFITLNEVDFFNLTQFYTFKIKTISNFWVYEKGYLPKEIILSVLKLYGDKTSLKGVEGKEKEYLNSKEMINSCYGMCVTNTMKENVIFVNGEWVKDSEYSLDKEIEKYNKDRNRFLFYPWGVWITSYARKNLFNGILNTGNDYIYSDTDSLKITNKDNYKDYFTSYNNEVNEKLKKMCEHYDIDFSLTRPKTIKGIEKPLGVWDYEGTYTNFKTLGAKRYMTQENDSYEITIAGLSKNAINYIVKTAKENNVSPFEFFNDYMYVPEKETGKNTHTYIDSEYKAVIIDFQGVEKVVLCKSGIHLSPCDFTLNMGESYLDYLLNKDKYIGG